MLFHIGDKVKITDTGKIYSSYPAFFDWYREIGHTSQTIDGVINQYELQRVPDAQDLEGTFTVCYIHNHQIAEFGPIAIINNNVKTFIIGIEGLTLVSSDIRFHVGDTVKITNTGNCYTMYDDLLKGNKDQIYEYDKVRERFVIGRSPSDASEFTDPASAMSVFKVMWVGHHPNRVRGDDIIAVITNSKYTFIMGCDGIDFSNGETSWDKYIKYLKNWVAYNREDSSSEGPKKFSEWIADKQISA